MKRNSLLGAFYIFQGIGNLLWFFMWMERFFVHSRGGIMSLGIMIAFFHFIAFDGGGMAGLEVLTMFSLFFASCLSLFTGLVFLSGSKGKCWVDLGTMSSFFLILFYGFLAAGSYRRIVLGYDGRFFLVILVSLIIVVLNFVSVFGLYSLAKDKRIRD